jgi:hypothetical protein
MDTLVIEKLSVARKQKKAPVASVVFATKRVKPKEGKERF